MTSRERFIETLTFGNPDKIPFMPGGPRESTLARWRKEGLAEGIDWFEHLTDKLGIDTGKADMPVGVPVDFRMIPQFEEKIIDRKKRSLIVQDWKGNICEISDEFDVTYLREAKDFVTRRWVKCPVENRGDWEQMKARYNPNDPARLPADFVNYCEKAKLRDHMLTVEVAGPFWQLREWCGFEGLCMMMIEQPELIAEMAEFWKDFVLRILDRILEHIVFDHMHISEDMAYKAKSMISPEMVRQFCMPSWIEWTKRLRDASVPIIDMDSDGFIGELIPLWIESGINVCDPIEVAAHCDINEFRQQFGRKMAYRQGVDKRCMAKGGEVIRQELKRIEPVLKDGGYIPGCDHGVPTDISWPNFVDYARLLAQMTGWL